MSSTQAMCTSFKSDVLNGIHALSTTVVRATTTADTFKSALYFDTATLSATTTVYSSTNELGTTGTGYTAGGVACVWNTPATGSGAAYVNLNGSITYSSISTGTAVQAVLIYNNTQSNKAVAVYTFTAQTITSGTLALTMPPNTATEALLRIG